MKNDFVYRPREAINSAIHIIHKLNSAGPMAIFRKDYEYLDELLTNLLILREKLIEKD